MCLITLIVVSILLSGFGELTEQSETIDQGNAKARGAVFHKKFQNVNSPSMIQVYLPEERGEVVNGKREGPWTSHYKSGRLMAETNFRNGIEEGPCRGWYADGKLMTEFTYKDGKEEGLVRWWYENGQLKEQGIYRSGKEHGLYRRWHYNGQLDSEQCFSSGEEIDISNCRK